MFWSKAVRQPRQRNNLIRHTFTTHVTNTTTVNASTFIAFAWRQRHAVLRNESTVFCHLANDATTRNTRHREPNVISNVEIFVTTNFIAEDVHRSILPYVIFNSFRCRRLAVQLENNENGAQPAENRRQC